ncbi:MAG TPA: NCS2 family permease [Vicinamibacterales bacterium]|jgi:AGZA family xanthine/uracil permease-like MFS transporter|nr:NCS2 family permease [Vicinamibacterales bacterium]
MIGTAPAPAASVTPLRRDIIGGVTTFVTMTYIVIVNPSILASPGTGMPFNGVLTATVLVAASMTLAMGLYARLPFAVAPGMGLNAFFAFTIVVQNKVPWPVALGIVFWAGVIFLLLSITPLRETVAMAIPASLRAATAAGIGLLLTFIGLRSAGVIVSDPATLLRLGALDHRAAFLLLGVVIAAAMMRRDHPLAFLTAIAVITALAWGLGYEHVPDQFFSRPDFSSTFLRLDIAGALKLSLLPSIVAIFFTDLFDSLSTFIGVSRAADLTESDGRPIYLRRGLIVDAFATLGAGLAGSSSGTAFVESIAGIRMGGRTGRASVVTALCFLPCFFIAPLAAAIPGYATAPILVLVGLAMFHSVADVDYRRLEESLPAFITIVLIPLTSSITEGILWGLLLHAMLYAIVGRAREVDGAQWVLAALSAGLLVLQR